MVTLPYPPPFVDAERGFEVVTLTDCTADTSEAKYTASAGPDGTFALFSEPMTSTEFCEKYL